MFRSSASLKDSIDNYFYLAKGAIKLASIVIEPAILDFNLRRRQQDAQKTDMTDEKRRIMVSQLVIRQSVSFFTDTLTTWGTGKLVKRLLKGNPNAAMWGLISSMLGEEIIGNLILRPIIMSHLSAWWEKRHTSLSNPPPAQRPPQPVPVYGIPAEKNLHFEPAWGQMSSWSPTYMTMPYPTYQVSPYRNPLLRIY